MKDGLFCEIVEWSEVLCLFVANKYKCRGFCVVYRWQNGTRCRDGVKVLWCRSRLVWLVFEDFIPTCACLRLANFFVTCFCCFFVVVV